MKIPAGAKELNVVLSPDDVMLEEVVVKPKKEKYSRKNNPAVEFMRKVIDHKKAQKLETNELLPIQQISENEDVTSMT